MDPTFVLSTGKPATPKGGVERIRTGGDGMGGGVGRRHKLNRTAETKNAWSSTLSPREFHGSGASQKKKEDNVAARTAPSRDELLYLAESKAKNKEMKQDVREKMLANKELRRIKDEYFNAIQGRHDMRAYQMAESSRIISKLQQGEGDSEEVEKAKESLLMIRPETTTGGNNHQGPRLPNVSAIASTSSNNHQQRQHQVVAVVAEVDDDEYDDNPDAITTEYSLKYAPNATYRIGKPGTNQDAHLILHDHLVRLRGQAKAMANKASRPEYITASDRRPDLAFAALKDLIATSSGTIREILLLADKELKSCVYQREPRDSTSSLSQLGPVPPQRPTPLRGAGAGHRTTPAQRETWERASNNNSGPVGTGAVELTPSMPGSRGLAFYEAHQQLVADLAEMRMKLENVQMKERLNEAIKGAANLPTPQIPSRYGPGKQQSNATDAGSAGHDRPTSPRSSVASPRAGGGGAKSVVSGDVAAAGTRRPGEASAEAQSQLIDSLLEDQKYARTEIRNLKKQLREANAETVYYSRQSATLQQNLKNALDRVHEMSTKEKAGGKNGGGGSGVPVSQLEVLIHESNAELLSILAVPFEGVSPVPTNEGTATEEGDQNSHSGMMVSPTMSSVAGVERNGSAGMSSHRPTSTGSRVSNAAPVTSAGPPPRTPPLASLVVESPGKV